MYLQDGWIDISIPLTNGLPPWPGDVPFYREVKTEIGAAGADSNTAVLTMSSHAGTHVDAPLHFLPSGLPLDRLDPGLWVGPAYLLDLSHVADRVEEEDLRGRIPCGAVRLLLKTRNAETAGDGLFHSDYVALSAAAAAYAAGCGVRLLGVDGCSIAPYDSPAEAHVAYLSGGGAAVENLDLRRAAEGWYDLVCLPLPVSGGDDAPARALIRRRDRE